MNLFEKLLADHEKAVDDYVATVDTSHIYKEFSNWTEEVLNSLETYEQTKDVNVLTQVFQQTDAKVNNVKKESRRSQRMQRRTTQKTENLKVKKEKISLENIEEDCDFLETIVKTEIEEKPNRPAPKGKKVSKRTIIKKVEQPERSSDVVICVPDISTVNLFEAEEETDQTFRATRTKTKNLKETQEKRSRETSKDESFESNQKKTKSDQIAVLPAQMNVTVVLEKPTSQLVVPESVMTDDGSASPNQSPFRIFSPFTTERQIEQFEKMQKETPKPRSEGSLNTTSAIPKLVTSTGKKGHKVPFITPAKFGVKNETRALDERRRDKEEIAQNKRDAIRQAETEEKKRRREEREQRVQRHRLALENEKRKQLEAQVLKDAADRRKPTGKDKKRLKEEMKTIIEKSKAIEGKAMMERKTTEAEAKEEKDRPLFMRTKAPLLPTYDCYDTDDERNNRVAEMKQKSSSWDHPQQLHKTLVNERQISQELKNSFYVRHTTTPDLSQVFENIEQKKLKRSSSAFWVKPPRYTMIHNLEDYLED